MIRCVLFALFISGFFDSPAKCEVGINTLRGIEKVKIIIEDLNADSAYDGITESALQAQAESALKQIGLKVTDGDVKTAGAPVLYVSLSADRADGVQIFAIRLEVLQSVCLTRDPAIQASSATTWSTFRFGRVDQRGYSAKIRSILTIMLQNFQDDFQSVNPAVWPLSKHDAEPLR